MSSAVFVSSAAYFMTASPSSTWTGRTSIAPCLAAGIFAAQVQASSIESHSKT